MVSFFEFAVSKMNMLQNIKWANSTWQQESHVAELAAGWTVDVQMLSLE